MNVIAKINIGEGETHTSVSRVLTSIVDSIVLRKKS